MTTPPPDIYINRLVQVANCVLFFVRHDASAKVDDAVAVAVAAVGAVVAVSVTSDSGFTSDDIRNTVHGGHEGFGSGGCRGIGRPLG